MRHLFVSAFFLFLGSPLFAQSTVSSTVSSTATVPSQQAAPSFHYGFLSCQSALEAMPGYADARRSLADLKAKYDAEMKRVEDEFNAKYEAFLDGQSTFAPSIREKRQAELQELMEKNQAFKDQAKLYLKNAEQDAYQPLREKLAAAIQRVGHAKGLAFVLNTDNGTLPFVNPEMGTDITADVLSAVK